MLKYAKSSNLPPLLQDFANHQLAIKNKSELTVDEYALDLIPLFKGTAKRRGTLPFSCRYRYIRYQY